MVTIDTMIDGEGASIAATRTVVLRFDRTGKAKILKSTIKFETETDSARRPRSGAGRAVADRLAAVFPDTAIGLTGIVDTAGILLSAAILARTYLTAHGAAVKTAGLV